MHISRAKVRICVLSAAALAGLAPVAFSPEQGLASSTAVCDSCCREDASLCIIGDFSVDKAYHKNTAGPCNPPTNM